MSRPILLLGAGRMGRALLRGWIRAGLTPLCVVEPSPGPELCKLSKASRIQVYPSSDAAGLRPRACVIALKPQVLKAEAPSLTPVAEAGATMISIAAGVNTKSLGRAWGGQARIVRAMPNTPGAIGKGISGLYAAPNAKAADRKLAESLLAPLGETLWVKREGLIDSITAVSGSGPAYVFLLAEALANAARTEGLSKAGAERLARATVIGAGALLEADARPASALRKDVTSPGGTTEAALEVLLSGNALSELIGRAVHAARSRAEELAG